jgi:hypothetical protein
MLDDCGGLYIKDHFGGYRQDISINWVWCFTENGAVYSAISGWSRISFVRRTYAGSRRCRNAVSDAPALLKEAAVNSATKAWRFHSPLHSWR